LFFRKGYEYADIDNEYLKEFVKQKKIVNKIIAFRRKGYSLHDHQPSKYSFMYLRADPIFRSFILDKFINVFMKSGKKKKIRNLLYRLFDTGRGAMTPNLFYKLVFDLKPSHLNVLARRGRIIYRAPIQASKTKGIMKAIKFFKTAVLAKKGEYSYYEKFEAEFFNHIY
jgi:ribosomal protein S7